MQAISVNRILPLLMILIFSCKDQKKEVNIPFQDTKEEAYSYEIYSQLINGHKYLDYVGLLPPPPPKFTEEFTEEDFWKEHDSLKMIFKDSILKVAISPVLFNLGKEEVDQPIKKGVPKELYEKLGEINEVNLDLDKLSYDKNRIGLSLLDTIRNTEKWKNRFKASNVILSYSRVAFSRDYNEALVVEGVTSSKVDGFSTMIHLKRENGKWVSASPMNKGTKLMYKTLNLN
ncbi:hypothetical protein [Flagellimonas onchidii]|uniref:hypothetical protein n=1 Tax=Flagellimonas onchidii TaxID=2562684 RepID=UPI0010A5BDA8|nr:hypothetical protein [Allomuricauda onchidii]